MARRLFGLPPFARQAEAHAVIAAADAFFVVSLAGSLFFSVSVDAARPRILLYLLLTMAPFAVVAPVIGPVIDRVPGGQRIVVALTCAGRGAVCFLMAGELRTLLFYPLAFSVLVLGKTYSVAKSALVPRLVPDAEALVEANARLSRLSAFTGALAGGLGAAVLTVAGAPWALRVGGALYLAAAALALRVPRPSRGPRASRAVERQELHAPGLRLAASAMSILRGGVGFLLFLVAFALKRAGEPAWFFGVVVAASGLGGLAATFVAPRARRAAGEETLLAAALALPATLGLLASLGAGPLTTVLVAAALGMGANAGRQAFDSLVQRDAPDVERGRLFARFETGFQLAWVFGALVAVGARPPLWTGFLLLGAVSGFGAVSYAGRERALRAAGQQRPSARVTPARAVPLPLALLTTAEQLCARGAPEQAAVVAAAAVDALVQALELDAAGTSGERVPRRLEEEVQRLRRAAVAGAKLSPEQVERALDDVRRLLSSSRWPG